MKSTKMPSTAIVNIDIQGKLPKVASGKVRDLYAVDDETLLFVASDRISAYDVIMENVSLTICSLVDSYLPHAYSNHRFSILTRTFLMITPGHSRQRGTLDFDVSILV